MNDAPPISVDACLARIASLRPGLPKRLRQCADHITAHLDRVAISTVADLAQAADVPPSAVIRFCQVLGFSGFSDLQRLFRDAYSPKWPDYATRLDNLKARAAGSPASLLGEFVEAGRLSLETLAREMDEAALLRAAQLLAGAELLHLVGYRRAFPVAAYLAYVLEKMNVPAILHDGAGALGRHNALRATDAVLAISFPPYSRETLELVDAAKARGLGIVAITDHAASPLARMADVALCVSEVDFGAFRTLSATVSLAMAIAVSVGALRAGPAAS